MRFDGRAPLTEVDAPVIVPFAEHAADVRERAPRSTMAVKSQTQHCQTSVTVAPDVGSISILKLLLVTHRPYLRRVAFSATSLREEPASAVISWSRFRSGRSIDRCAENEPWKRRYPGHSAFR